MKISNHTNILEKRFGTIRAIRMNCEAGFEAVDYSMYETDLPVFSRGATALIKEMRRVIDSCGAVFNQAHAPYTKFRLGAENTDRNREIFSYVKRSVEIAAELGAASIVVHPAFICRNLSADERYEMNMQMYEALLPTARSYGINIAIENMWGRHKDNRDKIVKDVCSDAAELIRYVDGLDSQYVCACLDVGHAGLVGESAEQMILSLGNRIGAIHIHDNDFIRDLHTLPYLGNIDFSQISAALAQISYRGDVTLEADCFLEEIPDALVPDALKFSAKIAAYIRDEINTPRKM